MVRAALALPLLLTSLAAHAADGSDDARVGIQQRVPWETSRVTGSPEPPVPYRLERVFPKLTFDQPVTLKAIPGGQRMVVAELKGTVYSFPLGEGGTGDDVERADVFFDASKQLERCYRLYDVTFHPRFTENRAVFICYTTDKEAPEATRVSRFRVSDTDPPRVEDGSEEILITWKSGGHNGGCLEFGPDGFLYISTGDGSTPNPPDSHDTGQDVSDLLASILRIDVDHAAGGRPYSVPSDNPFIKLDGARPEVWAYGLRNPWKMSFDEAGRLWVGDVGWEMWEMVYLIERGGNYGWSVTEGPQPVRPEMPRGPTPILPPTVAHDHTESRSLTGGLVYRGGRLPDLRGHYVYGDYVTGKIWSFRYDNGQVTDRRELANSGLAIITFGEGPDGELFVVGHEGTLHRLIPNPSRQANRDFPTKLSQTGLFASVEDYEVAPGVLPYSIIAEPWADGARMRRHIAVPGTGRLDVYEGTNLQVGYIRGHWKYPTDTVLMKTLSLPLAGEGGGKDGPEWRPVETQLLHRDGDTWRAYTFAWNADGTDADLVPAEGMETTFSVSVADAEPAPMTRQQTWRYAGRTECLVCHTTRGGSIYGFRAEQLDRPHDYDGTTADQLATLVHLGLFDDPAIVRRAMELPAEPRPFVDPYDGSADRDARARDYLHVNCSHCHLRGGGGTAPFELLRHIPLEETHALAARPTQGTFALYDPEVIAPGDPYRSVLHYRMATLGGGRMPHVGSRVVDERGLALIHDWIASLPAEDGSTPSAVRKQRAEQSAALERLAKGNDVDGPIDTLLGSTSGALRLLRAIDAGRVSQTIRERVVAHALSNSPPHIAGLFERFVPEERRTKRLGETVDAAELLRVPGNAGRGRTLFLTAETLACRNCHQVGEAGKEVGPRLDDIGSRLSRAEILESILEPSKKVDAKYLPWLVETSQGRVLVGQLVQRDEKRIVLQDASGEKYTVPANEIEQLVQATKSLMPELQFRDLTAEQLADLVAFLASLKDEPTGQ